MSTDTIDYSNNTVSPNNMVERQPSNTSFITQTADSQQSNADQSASTIPTVTVPLMTTAQIPVATLPDIASLTLNAPPPPAAFALDAPKLDVSAPLFTPSQSESTTSIPAVPATVSLTVPTPSGGVQGLPLTVGPLDITGQINVLQQQSQQSMAKLQLYALQLNTLQLINQQNSTMESLANYQNVYHQYQMELTHSLMIAQTIQSLQSVLAITASTPQYPSVTPSTPCQPNSGTSGSTQTPMTPMSTSMPTSTSTDNMENMPKLVGKLATIEEGEDEEMDDQLHQDSTPEMDQEAVAQIAGIHTNYSKSSDHEGDSDSVAISPSGSPPVMTGKHGERLDLSGAGDSWKFPEITSTTNAVGERNHEKGGELERIKKQIRGILNKITPENFDKLSQDISSILKVADLAVEGIDDVEQRTVASRAQFKSVIKLILRCILEKAINEPLFSNLFARLCYSLYLHSERTTSSQLKQKLFRQQLLSLCHSVFKRARGAALKDSAKSSQFIGIITMIGELFTYGLVSWNVINSGIFSELLPPQCSVDIQAVCKLLKVSGHNFDRVGHREDINVVVGSLSDYAQPFGFRTQCLVQEIVEMRRNDWKQKIQQESPQRLEQIHQQFYAEQRHGHGHDHNYQRGVVRPQRQNNHWRPQQSNGRRYRGGNVEEFGPRHGQYQQRRYGGNSGYGYGGHSASGMTTRRNQSGHGSYRSGYGHQKGYGGNNGHHYQRRKGQGNRHPSVEFVKDVTLPDRSHYPSNKVLTKTWAMKNSGDLPWGDDVQLVYFKGDETLCLDKRYPVMNAAPGQTVQMSATVRTPTEPGRYCTYFRLQKNGKFFGPRVWVDIIVSAANSPRSIDGVANCSTNKEAYKKALTGSIQSQ